MTLLVPEFLQSQRYSALRDRLALSHLGVVQPGIVDTADYAQQSFFPSIAGGRTMNINVAAGYAFVQADNANNKGLYHVESTATEVKTVRASDPSLPRVDQVVLTIHDSTHGVDGSDVPEVQILTGTPTASAQVTAPETTSTYRRGAAAIPNNSLLLADILVPAGATFLNSSDVFDRRPWALGNFQQDILTADRTTTSATMAEIDASTFFCHLELSNKLVEVVFQGRILMSASGQKAYFDLRVDGPGGAWFPGLTTQVSDDTVFHSLAANHEAFIQTSTIMNFGNGVPFSSYQNGRFKFYPRFRVSGGATLTLRQTARLTVREIPLINAATL